MAWVRLVNDPQWLKALLQKTGGKARGVWYIKDGQCYLSYNRTHEINRDPAFDRFTKALEKSTSHLL